jgi:hypothetical protein
MLRSQSSEKPWFYNEAGWAEFDVGWMDNGFLVRLNLMTTRFYYVLPNLVYFKSQFRLGARDHSLYLRSLITAQPLRLSAPQVCSLFRLMTILQFSAS